MDQDRIEAALERVRHGDREAFRDVLVESVGVLRAHIRFYVSDASVADDVLQDVYIQIYQNLHRYEAGTSFIAWAKTLSRHAALTARNRISRRRRNRERYRDELLARVEAEVHAADAQAPVEARLAALTTCLEWLTARARRLVELHYFSGQDLATAGRQLGMKANAAAVALHRARAVLGECIEKGGVRT